MATAHNSKSQVLRFYRERRARGERAEFALKDARTLAAWHALERIGAVSWDIEPDSDHDLSFLDTWGDSPRERRAAAQVRERAESDGCWGLVLRYRSDFDTMADWGEFPDSGRSTWGRSRVETGASIWGMIGQDDARPDKPESGGAAYFPDLARECIDQFRAAYRDWLRERADLSAGRCPVCHGTGRAAQSR